jgi:serine protease Do
MQDERRADNAASTNEESSSDVPHLGLTVAPAKDVSGAGSEGVVVTAVEPDGVAAEHGMQSGDVILDVGGKTVSTVSDVKKAIGEARTEGKHSVLLRVKGSEGTRFVAMPVGNA